MSNKNIQMATPKVYRSVPQNDGERPSTSRTRDPNEPAPAIATHPARLSQNRRDGCVGGVIVAAVIFFGVTFAIVLPLTMSPDKYSKKAGVVYLTTDRGMGDSDQYQSGTTRGSISSTTVPSASAGNVTDGSISNSSGNISSGTNSSSSSNISLHSGSLLSDTHQQHPPTGNSSTAQPTDEDNVTNSTTASILSTTTQAVVASDPGVQTTTPPANDTNPDTHDHTNGTSDPTSVAPPFTSIMNGSQPMNGINTTSTPTSIPALVFGVNSTGQGTKTSTANTTQHHARGSHEGPGSGKPLTDDVGYRNLAPQLGKVPTSAIIALSCIVILALVVTLGLVTWMVKKTTSRKRRAHIKRAMMDLQAQDKVILLHSDDESENE